MAERILLYKDKGGGLDRCKYIDTEDLTGEPILRGATFSETLSSLNPKYSEIHTFLTEEEWDELFTFDKPFTNGDLRKLSEIAEKHRYKKWLVESIDDEAGLLSESYPSTPKWVWEEILSELDFNDRSAIERVYDDYGEVGREHLRTYYSLPSTIANALDFEKYGKTVVEEDQRSYKQLPNGSVAKINYGSR